MKKSLSIPLILSSLISLISLVAALLLSSCAPEGKTIPEVQKAKPQFVTAAGQDATYCANLFPQGNWQFEHRITFSMPHGRKGTLLGVTKLTPSAITNIHCALMTIEGLTVFEATATSFGTINVTKALPPFDKQAKQAFADGLMADIRTIFLRPAGKESVGKKGDEPPYCRYATETETTDILPNYTGDAGWFEINRYRKNKLQKHLAASLHPNMSLPLPVITKDGFPERIELSTYTDSGKTKYTLTLTLIKAQRIE